MLVVALVRCGCADETTRLATASGSRGATSDSTTGVGALTSSTLAAATFLATAFFATPVPATFLATAFFATPVPSTFLAAAFLTGFADTSSG